MCATKKQLLQSLELRNRVVVFVDWMWSYFTYERALRLIVRPYNPSEGEGR